MTVFFALLLLVASGLVLGRRRLGRGMAAAGVAAIFLWGSDPFTVFFAGTLERRYGTGALPDTDVDAIVVLGGNTYPPDATQAEVLPGYSTYLRCHHAALLYRTWKARPVVATGGPVSSRGKSYEATEPMRRILESEGVPAARIWVENRARNTMENAAYTAELLRRKGLSRVALVTDAIHMPRAQTAFERQGLSVVPAPCSFQSARFEGGWREYLIPREQSMLTNQEALHEWLGRAWYAVKGMR